MQIGRINNPSYLRGRYTPDYFLLQGIKDHNIPIVHGIEGYAIQLHVVWVWTSMSDKQAMSSCIVGLKVKAVEL